VNRLSLPLVVAGTALVALAYGAALLPGDPPAWSPYALALGTGALLSGLLMAGAARRGSLPLGVGVLFLGTGLWVTGGLWALLALPGVDAADAPLFLGLPRRAAFLLLGVGLAPGLVVPVAYGLVFDRSTLTDEDLARLREVAAQVARETTVDPAPGPSGSGGEG
jgi:hypothetical protein